MIMAFINTKIYSSKQKICAAAAGARNNNNNKISQLLLSYNDNNNNNEISELNMKKIIMFSGSKKNSDEINDSNTNKSNSINEQFSFHLDNKNFNDRRRRRRHIHNLVLYFFIFILINVYIDGINAQQHHNHNHHHHNHPDHQQQTEKHFVNIHKTANFYNNEPSKQFSKYTIIKPKLHHGRHKREISNTLEEEGTHASHIKINYEYLGKDVILDLVLNYDLIPHNHFMSYQTSDGDRIKNFTKTDVDLCHYKGNIRNIPNSRVALSTCNGVKGIVYDGIETFYIDLPNDSINNSSIENDHHLYKHSDMIYHGKCGYEGGINKTYDMNLIYNNHLHTDSEFNRILRYKRSTTDDTELRGPYNANKNSAYVELVLVVDNKVFKTLGSLKKVHSHCKDIANIINALYVPLNLFIALVGIVVWNEINEVELSSDGDTTLKNFLLYRKKVLVKKYPNDNAQLLTKEQFEGGVVGKALKGPICTYEFSGGVSMDHSQIVSVVATTVAHEMGHNFGMEHDTSDCKCIDERCIMSASSSSVAPLHWSSCSIDQLNLAFHHGMNYCLRNKPTKLFESPQCGNGFVEAGEQCDCGLPEFCENTCCNPQTCMLHSNASCATGECCDLQTCRPRSPGTMCRAIEGECDLPEYCTGESEYCPLDHFKRDTESCNSGNAYCYEGSCRSRNDQCKLLWGPSGQSSEQCYEKNIDGSRHGNCGYDRINNVYINCSQDDILCGMLHCRHLNERLEFGMESVAVLSHTFISYGGNVVPCRTAIIDLGLESVDPGLTPNGAICGVDRMCVNRKCMAIVNLRATGIGIECPENCSGHGICDNKGYCHCDIGWAPPLCNVPGPGGSEHSGPATNINESAVIAKIMYIFFLGVVPCMLIILCTIYYCGHLPLVPRKASIVTKNHMKSSTQNGMGPTSPTNQQHLPTSTPSSTDDMNSSLLKADENKESLLGTNIFGQFKGFTLKPLSNTRVPNLAASNVAYVHPVSKNATHENTSNGVVPSRLAPPVPKPPISTNNNNTTTATTTAINVGRSKTEIKSTKPILQKFNTLTTSNKKSAASASTSASLPPALPPFNPGSCPRPLISSPILEASTCSAKELRSPLTMKQQNATVITDDYTDKHPIRPAPAIPHVTFEQPNKGQSNKQPDLLSNTVQKNSKDSLNSGGGGGGSAGGTIKRIASFLMKDDKKSSADTLQRNPSKIKPTIDKEKLKNIEISAPIPHVDTSDSEQHPLEDEDVHSMISRTQSMRSPTTDSNAMKRPNIHTFGSMRQPSSSSNSKRPGSVVIGGSNGMLTNSRPKSPPPPRPPAPPSITNLKIPGVPGYQNPPNPSNVNIKNTMSSVNKAPLASHNEYDDCEAIETSILPKSSKNIHSKSAYKDSDNIYSVIDEYSPISSSPPPASTTTTTTKAKANNIPTTITTANDSGSGLGLLGEIVNEIENRNLDSIYSVSTLNRKKKKYDNDNNNTTIDKPPSSSSSSQSPSSPYVNTSDINDSDGAEYIAVKSNASTTSSGYLRPTAIHTPVARVAPVKPNHDAKSKYLQQNTNSIDTINNNNNNNNSLSSFRTNKDNVNNINNNNSNQRHSIEKDDDKKTTITNRYLNKTNNNQSININTTGKTKTNNNVPEKPPFTTLNNNNKPSTVAAPAPASATINRTKTIPSNSQSTINSIRTRSPSPSFVLTSQINRQKSGSNTSKSPTPQRKLSNTKPPIIGGVGTGSITSSNIMNNNNNNNKSPDLVNSMTTTINKSKSPDVINNNTTASSILSQSKPKPLAKPLGVTSSNGTTAINTPSTTTSTSNNTHAITTNSTTKKWQPQSAAQKFNTENKILNNINNNKLIGNGQIRPSGGHSPAVNNSGGGGGSTSITNNKSSNIASLQQKFENTNKDQMITKK